MAKILEKRAEEKLVYWNSKQLESSKPEEIEKYMERGYKRGLFSRLDEKELARVS